MLNFREKRRVHPQIYHRGGYEIFSKVKSYSIWFSHHFGWFKTAFKFCWTPTLPLRGGGQFCYSKFFINFLAISDDFKHLSFFSIFFFGGGGFCNHIFVLDISSIWVKIGLHTKIYDATTIPSVKIWVRVLVVLVLVVVVILVLVVVFTRRM